MTFADISGPKGRTLLSGLLVAAVLLPACNSKGSANTAEATDTPTSGRVAIGVDETFAPILESQVDTFQKLYSDAHVQATYQPEDSVLLREGLTRILRSAGHDVVAAYDNADALLARASPIGW